MSTFLYTEDTAIKKWDKSPFPFWNLHSSVTLVWRKVQSFDFYPIGRSAALNNPGGYFAKQSKPHLSQPSSWALVPPSYSLCQSYAQAREKPRQPDAFSLPYHHQATGLLKPQSKSAHRLWTSLAVLTGNTVLSSENNVDEKMCITASFSLAPPLYPHQRGKLNVQL